MKFGKLSLSRILACWAGLALLAASSAFAAETVNQSARQIPVAETVDVVVVGGGSGAVAAASEAAKAGAKVFLIAPRPYLGEDLAGTMRLWLEPGETPATELARKLYAPEGMVTESVRVNSLKFTYQADQAADPKHPETNPPSVLGNGKANDVQHDTVQYARDVTITADLGEARPLKEAQMVLFNNLKASPQGAYGSQSVAVSTSLDSKTWSAPKTAKVSGSGLNMMQVPLGASLRYVRFIVKMAPGAKRQLISEVMLVSAAQPGATPIPAPAARGPIRPMHIKRTLDQALLAAGVRFLYGAVATDLLRDEKGQLCGVVMTNRAGRQAIIAKTIIDATEHAVVARLAGAEFSAFQPGPVTVKWITIADKSRAGQNVSVRDLNFPLRVMEKTGKAEVPSKARWFEYTMTLDLPSDSWAARAALEQQVRDLAYDPTQLYSSDVPFIVPPTHIKGRATGEGSSAPEAPDALNLGALRPAGIERLWVLGGCADLPRNRAEKLLRPVAIMTVGARVGRAAAEEAKKIAAASGMRVVAEKSRQDAGATTEPGDAKEPLAGLRARVKTASVPQDAGALPVLGRYDVVVIGGGTAGAPAGIGAARRGAKTLVVEYLDGLGGVGTLGMIDKYWYGNKVGFTAGIPENPVEVRMEWYRAALRKAGAEIWFSSFGCGAFTQGNRVTGVVIATPLGRGVVLAKSVIDATGNSDIAIDAGAQYDFVSDDFALQNAHLPQREVGAWYINDNWPAMSDADPLNVRSVMLAKSTKFPDAFDWGQVIDTRERRRIIGDYSVDWLDIINERTFPDTIVRGASDYDSHGYQVHPYFALRPARIPGDPKHTFYGDVPYRCLLPQGIDGILVVGLGMSAHRDAMPILRMQPDLHNQGYAAGCAAAMAAQAGITPRQVDVKALQKHLVEIGNLKGSVLTDKDSYPLPATKISAAIASVKKDFVGIEALLAQPESALPALRQAYAQSEGADKVAYALVLGVMGDAAGLDTLIKEAGRLGRASGAAAAGDDAADLGGQDFGAGSKISMTTPDRLSRIIWSLGYTRNRRALPVLLTLAGDIPEKDFKNQRALAVSLGRIGDKAAAPVLARMLRSGKAGAPPTVRELDLAVALFRCGDQDGLARAMLERFAIGDNGPWAELATKVLSRK